MAKRPVSPALLQQVARIAQRALPAPGAPHLDDLYDGDDIGSWLTRALAWRVDADADAADARAAEATRGAIIANLRDAAAQASANRGVGGLVGDGATVYGLSLAAHLLEAPTLLDAAADHARLHLTAQRLHADRHLDLVLGTGGALLALLAWLDANAARPAASPPARSDDRDVVRARAVDAGEALCAAIDTAIDRHPTLRRSGMAHGAAGIAYALARLDAHLDRDPSSDDSTTLRDAVRTLIAHENRLRIDGNRWRDTDDRDDGLEAWCAGTPGIAAARRASARLLTARDPALAAQLDADADIAFTHARRQPYGGVDHLCCGNLGRTALLIWNATWGIADGAPGVGVDPAADALMLMVLRGFKGRGDFGFSSPDAGSQDALFKGRAGLVHALHHAAHPARLPLFLLFETTPGGAAGPHPSTSAPPAHETSHG